MEGLVGGTSLEVILALGSAVRSKASVRLGRTCAARPASREASNMSRPEDVAMKHRRGVGTGRTIAR